MGETEHAAVEQLRIELRLAREASAEMAEGAKGLAREVQRLELAAHARMAEQETREAEGLQRLMARLEAVEAENRRYRAEADALREERYAKAMAVNQRMQRKLEVAQAVAKLVPPAFRSAEGLPRAALPDAGQQEMIQLLRSLVAMVSGKEAPESPGGSRGGEEETLVTFPPEPLWPDVFRQGHLTEEDYRRELGQEP